MGFQLDEVDRDEGGAAGGGQQEKEGGEQDTESGAEGAEQEAFGEKAAGGTERKADGDFVLVAGGAGDEQTGDIGRGDEEDTGDRGEQDERECAGLRARVFVEMGGRGIRPPLMGFQQECVASSLGKQQERFRFRGEEGTWLEGCAMASCGVSYDIAGDVILLANEIGRGHRCRSGRDAQSVRCFRRFAWSSANGKGSLAPQCGDGA